MDNPLTSILLFLKAWFFCGDSIISLENETKFTLESPRYPKLYPKNLLCTWLIEPIDEGYLVLYFESFQLDDNDDYFAVGIGDTVYFEDRVLQLKSRKEPNRFVVNSTNIWIQFNSDDTYEYSGFRIVIQRRDSFGKGFIAKACKRSNTIGQIPSQISPYGCNV